MAIMDNLNGNIEALKHNLSSPYNFKGSTTFSALPASGNNVNDTYYCTDKKCNYTWNGSAWSQSSIGEAEYQAQLTQIEENFNNEVNNLSSEIAELSNDFLEVEIPFAQGTISSDGTLDTTRTNRIYTPNFIILPRSASRRIFAPSDIRSKDISRYLFEE